MSLTLTFLGTGTSGGIPELACSCKVCRSRDPKDKRTRCSSLISYKGKNILIDASTDLREQFLREKVTDIDSVLFTHAHADHCFGIDDLRGISMRNKHKIPIYADNKHMDILKKQFSYIFDGPMQPGGGVVDIDPKVLSYKRFPCCGLSILPVRVMHGRIPITGYIFGKKLAYVTDASSLPPATIKALQGIPCLVLNALRPWPHSTHFSLEESLDIIEKLQPKKAWLVHMTHNIGHKETSKALPRNVKLAYDGLKVRL